MTQYDYNPDDDPADHARPVRLASAPIGSMPRNGHTPAQPPPPSRQGSRGSPSFLDGMANDLAQWINTTADDVARAFAPGRAPFSADLSEEQKVEYYRAQLFNPDGSPNVPGRTAQINRLGAAGFAQVYKAILQHHPELRVPTPPEITVPGVPAAA